MHVVNDFENKTTAEINIIVFISCKVQTSSNYVFSYQMQEQTFVARKLTRFLTWTLSTRRLKENLVISAHLRSSLLNRVMSGILHDWNTLHLLRIRFIIYHRIFNCQSIIFTNMFKLFTDQ